MERKTVYVYSDWHVDAIPRLMGELQIPFAGKRFLRLSSIRPG